MKTKVNLAISVEKLARLIHDGHLCATDFTCLDGESKNQVWQLCLWCCNKKIHCIGGHTMSESGWRTGLPSEPETIDIKTV